jgi:hypothetical protein
MNRVAPVMLMASGVWPLTTIKSACFAQSTSRVGSEISMVTSGQLFREMKGGRETIK